MKVCPKCGAEYEGEQTLCPIDGEALQKTGDALIGQTLAGKYRIEERIAEGGMGTVYRATHVLMEKTVAIKVLHPMLAADEKVVARFTREAKAASRISHPHALTVTDFGESEDGIVFLVMEYLRGRTLKDLIRSEGPMPLSRVVEITRQVCGALEAAHAEGVIHRDLKSDNIMLIDVEAGKDWTKVLDFGIAKIQKTIDEKDPALTAPNIVIGTPQYMSPEQCSQSSEMDSRSDIYSLGIIIYEMLTAHVPFTGESPTAIMMKHLQEPAPSVLYERDDLPIRAGRVVERALAKRPEDRFQTACELAEALSSAATGESQDVYVETGERAALNRDADVAKAATVGAVASEVAREDYDEATLIRRGPLPANRINIGLDQRRDVPPPQQQPPEPFNPLRVAGLAIVILVAVFGLFYAFRLGSSEPNTEEQRAQPLQSDPKAQPVKSLKSASGDSEKEITSKGPSATVTPSDAAASGAMPSDEGRGENLGTGPLPIPAANPNDAIEREETSQPKIEGVDEPPAPQKKDSEQQPTLPNVKAKPDVTAQQPQPGSSSEQKRESASPPPALPNVSPSPAKKRELPAVTPKPSEQLQIPPSAPEKQP